ncbi:MAG: metallophosphatase family protein [Deltaproteobacteria bacterium]|nr:metallophosphatase family protein [Deltaproteobacteria bacterium]
MRIAVLSDIHGNLEALNEVLADLDRRGVDRTISLGDNVGYGPEPEAVVRTLRERDIPSVMGNHEWALGRPENLDWFNPTAREALVRTEALMSEASLSFCRSLPASLTLEGCRFVHGIPPDDVITYLFQADAVDLERTLTAMEEETCFVGHTHELLLVELGTRGIEVERLGEGRRALEGEGCRLINAGSVGQPRDGDNRAKYVIWDTEPRVLEVRFVSYDIRRTAEGIVAAGIPEIYADRLW